jgi:hypothetical protein
MTTGMGLSPVASAEVLIRRVYLFRVQMRRRVVLCCRCSLPYIQFEPPFVKLNVPNKVQLVKKQSVGASGVIGYLSRRHFAKIISKLKNS